MWKRKRADKQAGNGTAVIDRPAAVVDDFQGSDAELRAEIERLAESHRNTPDRPIERRLLALRHIAGIRALEASGARPEYPEPDFAALPEDGELPEFAPEELTSRARAGRRSYATGSCLCGASWTATRPCASRAEIDRAFVEREKLAAWSRRGEPGYYEEFLPGTPEYEEALSVRPWIREGGGVLAVDSPMLSVEMIEHVRGPPGCRGSSSGYLGEPAADLAPEDHAAQGGAIGRGAWHQDGSFMGDVRAHEPMALALALRRRVAGPRHGAAPARLPGDPPDRGSRALDPGLPGHGGESRRATSRSSGRSSSRATRCSSMTCSSTRRARIRRCRSLAMPSRTGSSAASGIPGGVRARSPSEAGAGPPVGSSALGGAGERVRPPAAGQPGATRWRAWFRTFGASYRPRARRERRPRVRRDRPRADPGDHHDGPQRARLPADLAAATTRASSRRRTSTSSTTRRPTARPTGTASCASRSSTTRVDHPWMVRTIQRLQHELIEPLRRRRSSPTSTRSSPRCPSSGTLGEYLDHFDDECVNCLGYELLHVQDREPPLDLGKPILGQRRFWFPNDAYDKPAVATVPMEWRPGFHGRGRPAGPVSTPTCG